LAHVTSVEQRHGNLARDLSPFSHIAGLSERRPEVLNCLRPVLRHPGLAEEPEHADALRRRRRLGQRSLEIRLRRFGCPGRKRITRGIA
jgi:hypothetical protein